jgi:phosphate:Na+ symporter
MNAQDFIYISIILSLLIILIGGLFYLLEKKRITDKYIYQADIKLRNYASTIKQILVLLGRLNTESDANKSQEMINKIKEIEREGNHLEDEVKHLFYNSNLKVFSSSKYEKINQIITVSRYLETLSDLVLKTAEIHVKRKDAHAYITPKLRKYLFEFDEIINQSSSLFIQSLSEVKIDEKKSSDLNYQFNLMYETSLDQMLKSLEKQEIKPISALFYKEIVINYEIIGNLLFKSNQIFKREKAIIN